jgi:small-conductance mechanosensitive channel
MDCPNCKLVNPPNSARCDCGYDFNAGAIVTASKDTQPVQEKKARVWKLVLGGFILLVDLVNSSRQAKLAPVGDLAGALGRLTGILVLVMVAVWLIASGLPKTTGLDKTQRRVRRKIWYVLVGTGLLVMVAAALLLAYLGLFAAAVAVTWLYWFGWTWISWLIADRRAVRRLRLK